MKVPIIILVIAGAVGAVGATTAPAPLAVAEPTATFSTILTTPRDTFSHPPRMAVRIAPVAAPAKPHPVAKKAVVKKTVHKAKPKPKPTYHDAKPKAGPGVPGSKCGATCQWHKTDSVWAKYPQWVETFALCVAHHESWSPHMWTAENPYSTASGGFQWIDGSWRVNLGRAGFSGPGHAAYASPILQAKVTAWVITHNGQRNWNGAHCGYGT